jgi:hypothetical protein
MSFGGGVYTPTAMNRLRFAPLRWLLSLSLVAASAPGPAAAQAEHCDPGLDQVSGSLGYRPHEDRCEGLYVQEVGSADLVVLSFTEVFEEFDAPSGQELRVEWATPGEERVRLRAQGVGKHYYRMDTSRPGGTTSFVWPSDVLAGLQLSRQEIGVAGWTRAAVGGTEREVYLPLRISQKQAPAGSDEYRLVLLPGRELEEVYVSLAAVGEDGEPGRFLLDGEALGYGYYPARRGVEIPISDLGAPGIYYLEVGARVKGGGSTAAEIWFFHPP